MCIRQEDCQPAARDCEAEIIRSETGTTYEWPSTAEGGVATFRCPLVENSIEIVSRRCGAGGVWGQFDETACGTSISGQLNNLVNLFSNVRQNWVINHSDYSYFIMLL
jgi:hypothetical protein